jgi:hypothetical protein
MNIFPIVVVVIEILLWPVMIALLIYSLVVGNVFLTLAYIEYWLLHFATFCFVFSTDFKKNVIRT